MANLYTPLIYKQTAMSHVDSLDDETKQLLKDIESQETHSNDSKESDNSNKPKGTRMEKDQNGNEYETNDVDTPDSEW